jgi:hypothetical protein
MIGMEDATFVIEDAAATELARIDVAMHGPLKARTKPIESGDAFATPERPLRVVLEWRVAGRLISQVIHLALTERNRGSLGVEWQLRKQRGAPHHLSDH